VKATDLTRARMLAFATHAVVTGELEGLAEPAIVLTPPRTATAEDDGLLTASETAELRLDTDFVLLSACNTAAPDGTPGASGLSGLAKAFVYFGARALLVSHWEVYSERSSA
jgi:CHAT domain-containing protein